MIVFLTSWSAHADMDFRMACTDETPTHAMEIREMPDEPTVVGEIFAFEGMNVIQPQASMLPDYLRFEWSKDRCVKTDAYVMKCDLSQDVQTINGHQIAAVSVETFNSTESVNGLATPYRNILFKILVDGQPVSIQDHFLIKECTDQQVFNLRPTI